MSSALTKIRERYPQLELTVAAVTDARGAEDIRRGRLDIAILSRFATDPPPPEVGVREWVLGSDALELCTPKDHPLAREERCAMPDLKDEGWVVCQGHPLGEITKRLCVEAGYDPRTVASVHDVATALGLVGVGWGLTIAPALTPAAGPPSTVQRIPIEGLAVKRYSVLIVRDGDQDLPEISAVVTAVETVARSAFQR